MAISRGRESVYLGTDIWRVNPSQMELFTAGDGPASPIKGYREGAKRDQSGKERR